MHSSVNPDNPVSLTKCPVCLYLRCQPPAYGILADLELHPYLCFVVPGAVCGYGAYATALFVAKDDRLADGVSRDAFVIWLCKWHEDRPASKSLHNEAHPAWLIRLDTEGVDTHYTR